MVNMILPLSLPPLTLYFPNTFLLHDVRPKCDLLICKRETNRHNHFYDLFKYYQRQRRRSVTGGIHRECIVNNQWEFINVLSIKS